MSYEKHGIILLVLLLMFPIAGAWGYDDDCDGSVIDAATTKTETEGAMSPDVYIAVGKEMEVRPGNIFKVFRPKKVDKEPAGEHRLMLYVGRLQIIDVQNEVLIGRMMEFAPRQEYPRVRYEATMIGDCLKLEPSMEPLDVAPEELGAETLDVSTMKIPVAAELPAGRRVIPSKILFKFDSSRIEEKWSIELEQLAGFIAARRPAKVIVGGHADWIGTDAYNVGLSERRAKAVVDYLTSRHGLERDIFEIKAYGESRPETSNETSEGRQKNRRAVVSVLFELIPTVEPTSVGQTEWPLAVEPEKLLPDDGEIPLIPQEPPTGESLTGEL